MNDKTMLSDDTSSDSDTGIRFKTDSTRRPTVKDTDLNKKKDDRRLRDSDRRNDSFSDRRKRERSPIRDRYSRDYRYADDRRLRENGDSHRSRNESSRKPDRRRSRSPKEEERRSDRDKERSRDSKSSLSRKIVTNIPNEFRNMINKHLQAAKEDERHSSSSEKSKHKPDTGKESSKSRDTSSTKSDTRSSDRREVKRRNSKSDESDIEMKPISYYNMVSVDLQEKKAVTKEIDQNDVEDVSDSSLDEAELRKQALLLKKELKNTTRAKKRSKHKERKHKKKKSAQTSDVEGSIVSTSKANDKCTDSNEEGEILSDSDDDSNHKNSTQVQSNSYGPSLPPVAKKTPTKPDSGEIEGPALPPHLLQPKDRNLGPTIPDDVRQKLAKASDEPYDLDSDNSDIGPLPEGSETKWKKAHKSLEERALRMKINSIEKGSIHETKSKIREEWMLELPDVKAAHLGLQARQFRAKAGPDLSDRSSWTDTPEIKALKDAGIDVDDGKLDTDKLQKLAQTKYIKERDAEHEEAIKKFKKKNKRDESLLEIHQKKLKKKKKKSEKTKEERRPFSREDDLKVNRFDEAQKKAILKKAQLLDCRFSSGQSKFL